MQRAAESGHIPFEALSTIGEVSSALPQQEKKRQRELWYVDADLSIDRNQGRGLPFGVPSSGLFVLL